MAAKIRELSGMATHEPHMAMVMISQVPMTLLPYYFGHIPPHLCAEGYDMVDDAMEKARECIIEPPHLVFPPISNFRRNRTHDLLSLSPRFGGAGQYKSVLLQSPLTSQKCVTYATLGLQSINPTSVKM